MSQLTDIIKCTREKVGIKPGEVRMLCAGDLAEENDMKFPVTGTALVMVQGELQTVRADEVIPSDSFFLTDSSSVVLSTPQFMAG